MPRNKMPSPAGPPQRQRWFDYIPPYIFNGRSHAELMKIIPVRSDWARVSLSLLWSQRVCINTWLHAKGLSQTGFWRFSPPDLFFFSSMMAANSLEREELQKHGTNTEESELGLVSRLGKDSLSLLHCRAPQHCLPPGCAAVYKIELPSLPAPLVLCHMFVLSTW